MKYKYSNIKCVERDTNTDLIAISKIICELFSINIVYISCLFKIVYITLSSIHFVVSKKLRNY